MRCKYCYRPGHINMNCREKAMKRPPSMPEWVSKAECKKCKKKGHSSYNCPQKYDIQDLYQSKLNHQKKNQMRNICHNRTRHKKNFTNLVQNQIYNKFCSYKYHTREIRKLCNTKSTAPSHKFKRLLRHFTRKIQTSLHIKGQS